MSDLCANLNTDSEIMQLDLFFVHDFKGGCAVIAVNCQLHDVM